MLAMLLFLLHKLSFLILVLMLVTGASVLMDLIRAHLLLVLVGG